MSLARVLDDLLCCALAFLDARDLCRVEACSHRFARLVSERQNLWASLVRLHTAGRCADESSATWLSIAADAHRTHRQRYRDLELDARRSHLTPNELCALQWRFRFKRVVDLHWQDPFHQGHPPIRTEFLSDHSVRRTLHTGEVVHMGAMTWRLYEDEMGFQRMQINHYPPSRVSRTARWGWRLSSVFVKYSTDELDPSFNNYDADSDLDEDEAYDPWWGGDDDEDAEGGASDDEEEESIDGDDEDDLPDLVPDASDVDIELPHDADDAR